MNKKNVAVIGANGFVGSSISKAILGNVRYNLIPITRYDPVEELIKKADIIIHSANPAKRWKAEKDTENDFIETVEKTNRLFELSEGKPFVLISSLSCRTQLNTNYGRHRRACELIVLTSVNSIVIRLGPMFGGNRKEDMLHDILSGKDVHISEETKYAYADVNWVGYEIVRQLGINYLHPIREIGAHNYVRLGNIRDEFMTSTLFTGEREDQIPIGCNYGPDANDVFKYARKEMETL